MIAIHKKKHKKLKKRNTKGEKKAQKRSQKLTKKHNAHQLRSKASDRKWRYLVFINRHKKLINLQGNPLIVRGVCLISVQRGDWRRLWRKQADHMFCFSCFLLNFSKKRPFALFFAYWQLLGDSFEKAVWAFRESLSGKLNTTLWALLLHCTEQEFEVLVQFF